MRIFIGLTEIAGIAANYAKGFQELGHETFVVLAQQNRYYQDPTYDLILGGLPQDEAGSILKMRGVLKRRLRMAQLLPRMIEQSDVFVFLWGTSFLPRYIDYSLIKRAGKKLVATFWGSDIRHADALRQEMEMLGVANEVEPFLQYLNTSRYYATYQQKKGIVDAGERYADLILSQPGYGQLQTRAYMRAHVPIDLKLFQFHIPDRQIPMILHTPSNRGIKGTEFVLGAVEQLKREGLQFEFRLIENMPNIEVRKLLGDADIVVDELFSETIGVLSTEAMASGAVTMVRYMSEYAGVPAGCPAINVTKDTLVSQLRNIITNRTLRRQLAEAGRPYVEANNDHIKVAGNILRWLEPNGIKEYDFVPHFHQVYRPF